MKKKAIIISIKGFYLSRNEEKSYKLIKNEKISDHRLALIVLISIVIEKGMQILGVSLPEKM